MSNGLIIILMMLILLQGRSQTIFVTNTNDSGVGSLREAVSNANNGDTIRFHSSLINSGSDTIFFTSGQVDINNKSITIIGLYNNSDTLFISGSNQFRIFSFDSLGKVVLDSMVLIDGNAGQGNGGAIYINNVDTLRISNSIISNNKALNGKQ